ncbi:MAG: hypothetical protein AAF663_08650 [Planctomycetota bacterium]
MADPAFTSFVLGYHGCDVAVSERVLAGKASLKPSSNDYDWLGDGIYFWEHNATRAFDFAQERSKKPDPSGQTIGEPAVIGAVIDLRLCLNLLDSGYIEMVKDAHRVLMKRAAEAGIEPPANSVGPDLLNRKLDCAVLKTLHTLRADDGQLPFDTVRGVFTEGDRLYDNAGFAAKTHIQLCVRDVSCIKGYFRPLLPNGKVMTFKGR